MTATLAVGRVTHPETNDARPFTLSTSFLPLPVYQKHGGVGGKCKI